jgi:hypothetical protein
MKILKLWIETGYAGCSFEDEIEVPDDYTDEQCEVEAKIFLFNHVEYGYELIEEINK